MYSYLKQLLPFYALTAFLISHQLNAYELRSFGDEISGKTGTGVRSSISIPVPSDRAIFAVAAGNNHTLIIKTDGSLWAVGNNDYGQLGDGTTLNRHAPIKVAIEAGRRAIAIAAGRGHSLFILDDGSLWAMGWNKDGQLGNGDNADSHKPIKIINAGVTAVAAGEQHSLFLKNDDSLWTMGWNHYGQLGYKNDIIKSGPEQVQTENDAKVIAIAAGSRHSLFALEDGSLWGMGFNYNGQLGIGTTSPEICPPRKTILDPHVKVEAIAAGDNHSLFIDQNRNLWGMGTSSTGRLGNAASGKVTIPITLETSEAIQAVAAGGLHTLYLKTDGSLWAMGYNDYGQLGDGTKSDRDTPVQVDTEVKRIAAGHKYSLYVKYDTLMSCGNNQYGQLGYGAPSIFSTPLHIESSVKAVAAGLSHSHFIKDDGSLWAMGYNVYGQLGLGTNDNVKMPQQVQTENNAKVEAFDSGDFYSIFILDDGTLWTMGNNTYGQLGLGTNGVNKSSPQPVNVNEYPNAKVEAIAAGGYHCLFILDDGSLLAMGRNQYGQLGDGSIENKSSPQKVTVPARPDTKAIAIAAGSYHSLFIFDDGSLWAMGRNHHGQLGLGTTGGIVVRPEQVTITSKSDAKAIAIAAGSNHSLFILDDGSLWTMGNNEFGQLGDGTTQSSGTPKKIADNVAAIAAGYNNSLFLKSDGTLWGMGDNRFGQVDDRSEPFYSKPTLTNRGSIYNSFGQSHVLCLYTEGSTRLHTVTFNLGSYGESMDGVREQQLVATGTYAIAPLVSAEPGWIFYRWDNLNYRSDINSDLTINAIYQKMIIDDDSDGIDDNWELEYFQTMARDGSFDSDDDGVADFFEFLYGSDPTDPTSSGFRLTVNMEDQVNTPIFGWEFQEGFSLGVHYKVSISTDLITWNELPEGNYILESDSLESYDTLRSKLTILYDYGDRLFIRLQKTH